MGIITQIMIAVGAGFAVGIGAGWVSIRRLKADNRLDHLETLKETRHALLVAAVHGTTCANAVLLKIHNCGGKLEEGQEWYSSCIDEAPERSLVSVVNTWQNISVDEEYKTLIRKIQKHNRTFIKTEEMKESFLKRNYERMGIIGSVVMEVYRDDFAYYYISYPVRENLYLIQDSGQFNILEITTVKLSKKYRKYSELDVTSLE